MKLFRARRSLSVALFLLAGCGGGGGGGGNNGGGVGENLESEPNDAPAQADALVEGVVGHGTVHDDTDTDYWAVDLSADALVSLEVFGNRFDFAGWTTSGNAPRVRFFDTDGTTELVEQSDELLDWSTNQDTDVLSFHVPASGTYYVAVDVADAAVNGGEYLVLVEPAPLPAPLQLELEPEGVSGGNDSDATAETLVPGTLQGFHVDDESDWFVFSLSDASLVTFTLQSHRNGVWNDDDDYFDAHILLRDAGLGVLDDNDDAFYLDSALHHVLDPGTYFLEVDECCAAGDARYFVEFTADRIADLAPLAEVEPNDDALGAQSILPGELVQGAIALGEVDVYSFVCGAGDRLRVQAFDQNNDSAAAGSITLTLEDPLSALVASDYGTNLQIRRTILTSSGTFFVRVTSGSTTDYALRVTQESAAFEVEPNDVSATAGAFDANGFAAGVIGSAGDADVFAFAATRGVPVRFACYADQIVDGFPELDGFGSTLKPTLTVLNASGVERAHSASLIGTSIGIADGLATVSLVFLPHSTGTFYVVVEDENGNFGGDSSYVLEKR
jgi:hypothetical protein